MRVLVFAVTILLLFLFGVPALRLSPLYLALATFALAVSVPQFPLKFSKFLGGSNGIHTAETATHLWLYVVGWSCAAISFAAAWLLLRGRIGRAFRAVRDSEKRWSPARLRPASARDDPPRAGLTEISPSAFPDRLTPGAGAEAR